MRKRRVFRGFEKERGDPLDEYHRIRIFLEGFFGLGWVCGRQDLGKGCVTDTHKTLRPTFAWIGGSLGN